MKLLLTKLARHSPVFRRETAGERVPGEVAPVAGRQERTGKLAQIRNHPIVKTAVAVQKRFAGDSGGNLAAALSYYGFLSVFPLLLLGASIAGFTLAQDPGTQSEWAERLSQSIPGLGPLVGKSLTTVIKHRTGAGVAGIAGLMWTGVGLAEASGSALGRVFRLHDINGFFTKKVWSVSATISLGVVALAGVAVAGLTASHSVETPVQFALGVAGALAVLACDFLLFLFAYRILTAHRGPPFRRLWQGSIVAALGWTTLKLVGTWYARRTIGHSTEVYGTFASTVGVLVLLHLASRLFLYGAELNATLIEMKGRAPMQEKQDNAPTTPPVPGSSSEAPQARSTPDLMRSVASDVATLVQKQVELARHEIIEAITARLKAVAAMISAVGIGLVALIFLGLSAASALDGKMDPWASRLIVTICLLIVTSGAVIFGLAKLRQPLLVHEKTTKTAKEDGNE